LAIANLIITYELHFIFKLSLVKNMAEQPGTPPTESTSSAEDAEKERKRQFNVLMGNIRNIGRGQATKDSIGLFRKAVELAIYEAELRSIIRDFKNKFPRNKKYLDSQVRQLVANRQLVLGLVKPATPESATPAERKKEVEASLQEDIDALNAYLKDGLITAEDLEGVECTEEDINIVLTGAGGKKGEKPEVRKEKRQQVKNIDQFNSWIIEEMEEFMQATRRKVFLNATQTFHKNLNTPINLKGYHIAFHDIDAGSATPESYKEFYNEEEDEMQVDRSVRRKVSQKLAEMGFVISSPKHFRNKQSDLDGEASRFVFAQAGVKINPKNNLRYIQAGSELGEQEKGKAIIDMGGKDGIVFERQDGKLTMYIDHHTPESKRDTSAANFTYRMLDGLGFFNEKMTKKDKEKADKIEDTGQKEAFVKEARVKYKRALENTIDFVTRADNKTFHQYFDEEGDHRDGAQDHFLNKSWKTLAGLARFVSPESLLGFFLKQEGEIKSKKSVAEKGETKEEIEKRVEEDSKQVAQDILARRAKATQALTDKEIEHYFPKKVAAHTLGEFGEGELKKILEETPKKADNKYDFKALNKAGAYYDKKTNRWKKIIKTEWVTRPEKQKRETKKTWEEIKKLEQEGLIKDSSYGKIVIDLGDRLGGLGVEAAMANGCAVYIKWVPGNNSFFLSSVKDLDDFSPTNEYLKLRKAMLKSPATKGCELKTDTLLDILNTMGVSDNDRGEIEKKVKAITGEGEDDDKELSKDGLKAQIKIALSDLRDDNLYEEGEVESIMQDYNNAIKDADKNTLESVLLQIKNEVAIAKEMKKLEKENVKLTQQVDALQKEKQEGTGKIGDLTRKNIKLTNQVATLTKEKENLDRTNQEQATQITEKDNKIKRLEEELTQAKEQLKQAQKVPERVSNDEVLEVIKEDSLNQLEGAMKQFINAMTSGSHNMDYWREQGFPTKEKRDEFIRVKAGANIAKILSRAGITDAVKIGKVVDYLFQENS